MFNRKDPSKMLPSELMSYINDLHSEVDNLEKQVRDLQTPDSFSLPKNPDVGVYDSLKDLLATMDLGDVEYVAKMRDYGSCYMVKLSDDRVDEYKTKLEAEHARMLHGF